MLLVRTVEEFERQIISVLDTGKLFLVEKIFNGLENVSPFTCHDKLFKLYILSIGSHNSNTSSLSIPTIYWYRIPSEATSDKCNCEINEELSIIIIILSTCCILCIIHPYCISVCAINITLIVSLFSIIN